MGTCSLCGLATPARPITEAGVDGEFCCRGCLEVHGALDDVDDVDRDALRRRLADEGPDVPDDAEVAFLSIEGMHCATCEGFVSLLGERVDGVYAVEASYATETARVHYDPDRIGQEALPDRLSGSGYEARFRDEASRSRRDHDLTERLLIGGFLTLLIKPWYLFYFYPSYVGIETGILDVDATTSVGLYFPMLIIGLLTSIILFYTGYPVLRGAYVSLRVGRPNMDLLVATAACSAYAYSTLSLATGGDYLYYDVTVAVIMVVSLGRFYERKRKRRATDLLSEVTTARSREATRQLPGGETETVSVDDLAAGDEVLVKPGERVPVDGTVVDGTADVDESVLTGESLPVTRAPGDTVVGGAVATDGALVVAVDEGAESTLDRIAALLWEVQSGSPGMQRFADRLATIFVPFVIAVAALVTGYRLATGASPSAAMLTGLTVLIVSCPCAMGLATPLAVASGLRDGLARGLVVTNAAVFESAPDVETIVFDKTGTLTAGEMTVRSVRGAEEAVAAAAAVERRSEHPVAAAITEFAAETLDAAAPHSRSPTERAGDAPLTDGGVVTAPSSPSTASEVSAFERHPGAGVSGHVDGRRVVVGTPDLVERLVGPVSDDLAVAVAEAREAGDLPVVVGYEGQARAVIVVGDREREAWTDVLDAFADREVVILTGDDEAAAERFRTHPAVDRVFAGVPPDGKVATVRRLAADRTTAMVGDGTNDAPALAAADLGVAMGSATAQAADAADAILAGDDLRDVPAVFELAQGTRRRIRENVAWALTYNAVAIPLAAAGVINPLFAAVTMAGSSIFVVSNSSRRILEER